jgi:hypothetical protein
LRPRSKRRIKVVDIKINVYITGEEKLKMVVTIPLTVLRIARGSIVSYEVQELGWSSGTAILGAAGLDADGCKRCSAPK